MIWIVYALVVLVVIGLLLGVARKNKAQTQVTSFDLPSEIDPQDFANKKAEVHVWMFSSEHCDGCESVWNKAEVLKSDKVEVAKISYQDAQGRKLHDKYQIEAVPSVVVCDDKGKTLKAFLGNVTATDLWAAVAEARGAEISSCDSH